jgi:hypothetical protein
VYKGHLFLRSSYLLSTGKLERPDICYWVSGAYNSANDYSAFEGLHPGIFECTSNLYRIEAYSSLKSMSIFKQIAFVYNVIVPVVLMYHILRAYHPSFGDLYGYCGYAVTIYERLPNASNEQIGRPESFPLCNAVF